MKKLSILFFLFVSSQSHATIQSSMAPLDPYIGLLGTITIHETGHAIMMGLTGIEIKEFRPYPNMCDGKFVGGCVIPGEGRKAGVFPHMSMEWKYRLVDMMGTGASIIASSILIPYMGTVRDQYALSILANMTHAQILDWPTYIVMDSLGFDGDWHHFSQSLGIPVWYFLPFAFAQAYYMDAYWTKYYNKGLNKVSPETAGFRRRFTIPVLKMRW